MAKRWKSWSFILALVLLTACATPDPRREAHRAACANAASEIEGLRQTSRISWTEYASLATVYADKCVGRSPQIDLKLSYLRMIAVKVDAKQISPEEAEFALRKLDYDMRMNAAQAVMQYQAQMRQLQLQERSVRAQERAATAQEWQTMQVPASRTTYCSGSRVGAYYSFFCN